jgi:hypothetical protein
MEFIAAHPKRQLLVRGDAIRFVVPGDYPARREPSPREPDDICDPWELAQHRGDPDPDDVIAWKSALENFHDDEPEPFADEIGHLFGPIEHLPVLLLT